MRNWGSMCLLVAFLSPSVSQAVSFVRVGCGDTKIEAGPRTSCSFERRFPFQGFPDSVSNGSASADLARGELKAEASAFTNGLLGGTGSDTDAGFFDRITILGDLGAGVPITFTMSVDGGWTGPSGSASADLYLLGSVADVFSTDRARVNFDYLGSVVIADDFGSEGNYDVDITSVSASYSRAILSVTRTFTNEYREADIAASLVARTLTSIEDPSGSVDFSRTATLRVDLPENVSISSESGFLLTEPIDPGSGVAPIPLPGALLLLASGMASLFALRRSRLAVPAG